MSQILKTILLLNTKTIMQRSACYQAWRENKKIYPNLTYYNLAEAVSKIWIIKGKKTGTLMYGINLGLEIWSSHEFLGSSSILLYVLVTQSCLTLCDHMDYSLLGPSVHRILQARILEWIAIPFFRGSSQPRDQTLVSCTAGEFFTIWGTRETHFIV